MDMNTFNPIADELLDKLIALAPDEKRYDLSPRGWMNDPEIRDQVRHLIRMTIYDGLILFLKNSREDNKS